MSEPEPQTDLILPSTCEAVVKTAATAVDAEPVGHTLMLRLPEGPVIGKKITIDATQKDGLMNVCHLSVTDPALAPGAEMVRIEYEHDKQGKFGLEHVYSVQSVRQPGGKLVLMENFLAASPTAVREEDFRPIQSEAYAQVVLKTLRDWTGYRAWQLKAGQGK